MSESELHPGEVAVELPSLTMPESIFIGAIQSVAHTPRFVVR
jgi:hypothetical protein